LCVEASLGPIGKLVDDAVVVCFARLAPIATLIEVTAKLIIVVISMFIQDILTVQFFPFIFTVQVIEYILLVLDLGVTPWVDDLALPCEEVFHI
jgi:hypothetical protein